MKPLKHPRFAPVELCGSWLGFPCFKLFSNLLHLLVLFSFLHWEIMVVDRTSIHFSALADFTSSAQVLIRKLSRLLSTVLRNVLSWSTSFSFFHVRAVLGCVLSVIHPKNMALLFPFFDLKTDGFTFCYILQVFVRYFCFSRILIFSVGICVCMCLIVVHHPLSSFMLHSRIRERILHRI